jgi:hypothetical protein
MYKKLALGLILVLVLTTLAAAKDQDKDVWDKLGIRKGSGFVGVGTTVTLPNIASIEPSIYGGYFVMKGLEIGPIVTLAYMQNTNEIKTPVPGTNTDQTITTTSEGMLFGIGPQMAYFIDAHPLVHPYVFLSIELMAASVKNEIETEVGNNTTTADTTGDMLGVMLRPKVGAMFYLTKKFGIDLAWHLSYNYMDGDGENDTGVGGAGAVTKADVTNGNFSTGFTAGLNFFF